MDLAPPVAEDRLPEVSGFRQRGERALRVLVAALVAGLGVGLVVGGIGSRVAMRIIFLTSEDWVAGLRSDDGFIIGRFDLADTLNLVLFAGILFGAIGAGAYLIARPVLLSLPSRLRAIASGVVAMCVVSPALVHADGVDFRVLDPLWLTVGLFMLIPFAYGALVHVATERLLAGPAAGWSLRGLLVILAAMSPAVLFGVLTLGPLLAGYGVREVAIDRGVHERWRRPAVLVLGVGGALACAFGVVMLTGTVIDLVEIRGSGRRF